MTELLDGTDEFTWLEEVDGADAIAWVRERNAESIAAIAATDAFAERQAEIRQVLDSDARIPYPKWRGEFFYSFWQDATNPRGVWRRTTPQEYRRPDPEWEVLLDVDALGAQEGESWVFNDVTVQRPLYERCLISLSRGGSDTAEVREFDLRTKTFVEGGYALPPAKSNLSWIDDDHVFVGTDFGPGSLTSSGYARVVKRWRRGTPLSEAQTVFEGHVDDVAVDGVHDPTPGFERSFVRRWLDFFTAERFLLGPRGEMIRLEVPDDCEWEVHREWLLVRPRTPWTVGEVEYPAGALLATRFDDFLSGSRDLTVLYQPDERSALHSWAWTKHHLIVGLLVDVVSRIEVHTPTASGWQRRPLKDEPEIGHSRIIDTDPEHSDAYLLATSGYLRPTTLQWGQIDGGHLLRHPDIGQQHAQ